LLYIRACSDQHFLELQVRYGFRVMANPGEWTEIGVAGAISMGALMSRPALRPSMPYASMLIIMDGVQIVMREWDK
jgi:hypothetical protein